MISSVKALLTVTAALELGAGVALLIVPSLMATILLGAGLTSPESMVIGRVAGAALLAIGVSCWLERNAQAVGLVAGALVYNVGVAGLLLYAATVGDMIGLGTWPAIVLHVALLAWCVACLRAQRPGRSNHEPRANRRANPQ